MKNIKFISFIILVFLQVHLVIAQVDDTCYPIAESPEFIINHNDEFETPYFDIAINNNGKSVAVWRFEGHLFAQILDSNGIPQGDTITVYHRFKDFPSAQLNEQPDVAMDDAGNFVVTWGNSNGDGDRVYFRKFDAVGNPSTDFIQVNQQLSQAFYSPTPKIGMTSDGDFVIVWQTDLEDGNEEEIFARRFAANGTPQGAEFRINNFAGGKQEFPDIGRSDDGNFIITWESTTSEGAISNILARPFNADGSPADNEFLVSSLTINGDQKRPQISVAGNGLFVISWIYNPPGDNNDQLYTRAYDANTIPINFGIQITDVLTYEHAISINNDGNYWVVWTEYDPFPENSFSAYYTQDGRVLRAKHLVNAYSSSLSASYPQVAQNNAGTTAMLWTQGSINDLSGNLIARRYSCPDATQMCALGTKPVYFDGIDINSNAVGDQNFSETASNDHGAYVIVFKKGNEVYARAFDANDQPYFNEILVTSNATEPADVSMDINGNFVVVWGEAGNGAVLAQRYNSNGQAVGNEIIVSDDPFFGWYTPRVAMQKFGNFMVTWANEQLPNNNRVVIRAFSGAGTPLTEVVTISNNLRSYHPDIAANGSGAYVVVYEERFGAEDIPYITGQQIRQNGNSFTYSLEFGINTSNDNAHMNPVVATDQLGHFTVAWQEETEAGRFSILMQSFTSEAIKIHATNRVVMSENNTSFTDAAIMRAPNGYFAIAATSYNFQTQNRSICLNSYDYEADEMAYYRNINVGPGSIDTEPAIAYKRDASFVLTWTDSAQDGDGTGVVAQVYDCVPTSSGAESCASNGQEFLINEFNENDQETPKIASDGNGNYAIAYSSYDFSGANFDDIIIRRYTSNNMRYLNEFTVDNLTNGDCTHPAIDMNSSGAQVVAYQYEHPSVDDADKIYATLYSPDYQIIATPQVSVSSSTQVEHADVALFADGSFVVTWSLYSTFFSEYIILARSFDATGAPTSDEVLVNTVFNRSHRFPKVAKLNNNDLVIVWAGEASSGFQRIFYRRFDAAMQALDANQMEVQQTSLEINYITPAVDSDANGNYVVVWTSIGNQVGSYGTHFKMFNAAGVAISSSTEITNTGNTEIYAAANPEVSMLPDGSFTIVGAAFSPFFLTEYPIYGWTYRADRTLSGAPFLIGKFHGGLIPSAVNLGHSSVAYFNENDFVVAYELYVDDQADIRANHYIGDSDEDGVCDNFVAPLSLQWLSFEAKLDDKKEVILNWETANEQNVSHFVVQKSVDGRTFADLEKITIESDLYHQYETLDSKPFLGKNYYRIAQTDMDGKTTYSEVRLIVLENKLHDEKISLFPNPARSHLTIAGATPSRITVFNATGHSVLQLGTSMEIEIGHLLPGVYVLEVITTTGSRLRKKFIKMQ